MFALLKVVFKPLCLFITKLSVMKTQGICLDNNSHNDRLKIPYTFTLLLKDSTLILKNKSLKVGGKKKVKSNVRNKFRIQSILTVQKLNLMK